MDQTGSYCYRLSDHDIETFSSWAFPNRFGEQTYINTLNSSRKTHFSFYRGFPRHQPVRCCAPSQSLCGPCPPWYPLSQRTCHSTRWTSQPRNRVRNTGPNEKLSPRSQGLSGHRRTTRSNMEGPARVNAIRGCAPTSMYRQSCPKQCVRDYICCNINVLLTAGYHASMQHFAWGDSAPSSQIPK